MSIKPTTTIRIDQDLKKEANAVFKEIGIGMSAAINTFLKAVVRAGNIPFDIKIERAKANAHANNLSLNQACLNKKDEFYTQYDDVAKELIKYKPYFNGKSVLCNCDDPCESAFFRYFLFNFEKFGLKSLTTSCYANSSLAGSEYQVDGLRGKGYKVVITNIPDTSIIRHDGSIDLFSIFKMNGNSLVSLQGDGDFRSDECKDLLNFSDIVVTNPPFSLFREYINILIMKKKDFIILGNMNAVTYKDVFPLFRDNMVWYGESISSGDRKFYVPVDYPLNASNCGVDENGRRFIRVKGIRWFTNIDTNRRHKKISLTQSFNDNIYKKYENYNAIEVSKTKNIPYDYDGIMGVPISFLDKYNPDQFEIIMLANGNAKTNVEKHVLSEVKYRPHPEDKGGVGIINGRRVYARVLIRRKKGK